MTTDIVDFYESWREFPIRMEERSDSIIITYIEKPDHPYYSEHKKVFKVIFSCVDGKWHKSERIYGVIIPASEESYEFND